MKIILKNISEGLKVNVLSEKFANELDKKYFSFRDQFNIPLKKDLPKSKKTSLFIIRFFY